MKKILRFTGAIAIACFAVGCVGKTDEAGTAENENPTKIPADSESRPKKQWREIAKLTGSDTSESARFGFGVDLDGNLAIIGAPFHGEENRKDIGAAYLFEHDRERPRPWVETQKILPSDAAAGDQFGLSVAISQDTLLIGSPGSDVRGTDSGAAYIYEREQSGKWKMAANLTPSDVRTRAWFGYRLDLSGDTAVVGVWRTRANFGSAYVFERNAGGENQWGEVRRLVANDPRPNDQFGRFLSIDGETIVVGAIQYGSAGPGKAYIFQRNHGGENHWGLVKKLVAEDAAADDQFGHGVSISQDTIVVGNYHHDSHGGDTGAAYVFRKEQGGPNAWGLVKKLTASDAKSISGFGRDVSIHDDIIVAGTPGKKSGACYVFQRNQGGVNEWGEVVKLVGSGASIGDGNELWVASDSEFVMVSAPYNDDRGPNAGCVYVFGLR